MAESDLHRRLKESVSRELQKEGYSIFEEPIFSPSPSVGWCRYRPDLFGAKTNQEGEDFVLVECETRPSTKKLISKNFQGVWLQTHISHANHMRRILAIPPGTLRGLDLRVRREWEIWIVEHGILHIPNLPPSD